jgi:homoserine/homoserine lactone efflux protein
MRWQTWLLFVITSGVLDATPGPAVLFVLSQAVRRGPAKSVWASAGILSTNVFYFALSATSLGAIIVASYNVFFFIKWVGAAYLIYLGLKCWLGRHSAMKLPQLNPEETTGASILRDGMMLQLANPKALIYFTAFLPQFIDPGGSVWFQVLILGATSTVEEFCVLFAYGQLAGRAWSLARNPRFERLTDRIGGTLLIGAGLGLARLRKA